MTTEQQDQHESATADPGPTEPHAADAADGSASRGGATGNDGGDASADSEAAGGTGSPTGPRRLVRPTEDRKIAGVASGIATYIGVDPVVVRVGFAILCFANGIGFVAYGIAWILMPKAEQAPPPPRPRNDDHMRLAAVALVFAGLLVIGGFSGWQPEIVWAAALIGIGFLLFREPAVTAGGDRGPATPEAYAGGWPEKPPEHDQPPPTRTRSLLGRATFGVLLLAVGVTVLLDRLGVVTLTATVLLALVLTITGVGLLIGTRWGSARGLIALGLVVLVPLTLVGPQMDRVRLSGGLGERVHRPVSVEDVAPEYRLLAGELALDLSELELGGETLEVKAGVTAGELTVTVPFGVAVAVTGSLGAGEARLFEQNLQGTGLDLAAQVPGDDGTIRLTVDHGLGQVTVRRAGTPQEGRR